MSTPLDEQTPLFEVLRHPHGRELLSGMAPSLVESELLHTYMMRPVGLLLATEDGLEADVQADILSRLRNLPPRPVAAAASAVHAISTDYEGLEKIAGSARATYPEGCGVWETFEMSLKGPAHGNPFVEVELSAEFTAPDGTTHTSLGFYDNDGIYRVRFLPSKIGQWVFVTASNARSLDGVLGEFSVTASDSPGPVRVVDKFHFAYANGSRFLPIGTTCYAWIHQDEELQEQTLNSLAGSGFKKLRMCLFPKSYTFNTNEPDRYPFQRTATGWDPERFDTRYWEHLESRIEQLADLGIEADLILFHAYDRWGFSEMDPATDDRYVRYAVARLSGFRNVWWSLANEFDLLTKTVDDWERWAALIQRWDPANHLRSIHNCVQIYDHGRPWITHVSMQRTDNYRTSENTTQWRETWGKPVVVDECSYEGDIDQGWGNITGEELTRRAWEGAVRGGYVGHGETYLDPNEVLWWSKGGELHGSSHLRFGFLAEVNREAPGSIFEPLQLEWDVSVAGVEDQELLYYFGFQQPAFRRFFHNPSITWTVDLIDTWNMTVERLPGTFSGRFRIDLPARKYMAVRLRRC